MTEPLGRVKQQEGDVKRGGGMSWGHYEFPWLHRVPDRASAGGGRLSDSSDVRERLCCSCVVAAFPFL